MSTQWSGGPITYHAQGCNVKFGPMIEKICVTRTGARFAAWRRRRKMRREWLS